MKNKLLAICSVLVILTMLVSCAPPAPAVQPATQPPAASQPTAAPQGFDWKKFSGTEITLLLNEHPWTVGLRTVIEDFTKETGIKVNMQPFAEDLYFDKMELALRSDKPVADVFFEPMDSTAFDQFSAKLIQPLTPYINDPKLTSPDYDLADFPEGFRVTATFPPGEANAELYAIPITFETYILFYNKTLVDKYLGGKVPETFDDLIARQIRSPKKGMARYTGLPCAASARIPSWIHSREWFLMPGVQTRHPCPTTSGLTATGRKAASPIHASKKVWRIMLP